TYTAKLGIQQKIGSADIQTLSGRLKASEAGLNASSKNLNAAIKQLHALNIRSLTRELNAKIPLVLLPVRIETRFVNPPVSAVPELWVRIFPDDIHANTHEPALTQPEITAGEQYWQQLSQVGSSLPADEQEEARKNAWLQLKETVTIAQRAIWVAKSTKPLNWADTSPAAPAVLQYPPYPEIKEHSWTRAPRTQALPDRF